MFKLEFWALGCKVGIRVEFNAHAKFMKDNNSLFDEILEDREAREALYQQLSGLAPQKAIEINGKKAEVSTADYRPNYADTFMGRFRRAWTGE